MPLDGPMERPRAPSPAAAPPWRRRKTAAMRREQRLRADGRAITRLVRAFASLLHHGGRPSSLGAALGAALAAAAGERRHGADGPAPAAPAGGRAAAVEEEEEEALDSGAKLHVEPEEPVPDSGMTMQAPGDALRSQPLGPCLGPEEVEPDGDMTMQVTKEAQTAVDEQTH